MNKAKRRKGNKPKPKSVSVTAAPWNGDHGTGTKAACAGTELVEVKTEDGRNPNRMKHRRRISQIDAMSEKLSMRQLQAARAIQEAYCRVEMQSSGAALKEQVDASPKPDAVIASQVDAMSHLAFIMGAVPKAMRDIIEHVCWHNQPIHTIKMGRSYYNRSADFKVALDLVANKLRY